VGLLPLLLNFATDRFLSGVQLSTLKTIFGGKKGTDQILSDLADLRHPHKWYTAARRVNLASGGRRIIFHMGPTNR